jgi:hypothetical protein
MAIAGVSEEELAVPAPHVEPDEDMLVATIIHTPRLPEANLAVFNLLSILQREERFPELREWVERLVDDPVITFRRPELAAKLRGLEIQFARTEADDIEVTARTTKAVADYERCAATYASLADRLDDSAVPHDDWKRQQLAEMRYNGAVCAEHAGHPLTALSMYRRVAETDEHLAAQASVRFVRLLGALPQIGLARFTGAPVSTFEEPRTVYDFSDDVIE